MEVLVCLAGRPGETVSKDELLQSVWAGTFVSEDALKRCVFELRGVLGDDARDPKLIQTIPKRGYRLLAAVRPVASGTAEPQARSRSKFAKALAGPRKSKLIAALAVSFFCLAVAIALLTLSNRTAPRVTRYDQITNDGRLKESAYTSHVVLSDGSRIYFQEKGTSGWAIAQASVAGGEVSRFRLPFEDTVIFDISPDQSKLLIGGSQGSSILNSLWVFPLPNGPPWRVGNLFGGSASWSPDGKLIAYSNAQNLYVAKSDGSESREVATFKGVPYLPRWSPDGAVLRFTVYDPASNSSLIWSVSPHGSDLHPLFSRTNSNENECCGVWSHDGRYFVFERGETIWAIRDGKSFFDWIRHEPVQLTSIVEGFEAPSFSPDGKQLLVFQRLPRGELMRYDGQSRQFVPYLAGLSAEHLDFSSNHEWVTYVSFPDASLWRCRVDGTQRLQLTRDMLVAFPRWSPDGKWIAFSGSRPGQPWKLYLIAADGGNPEQLIQGGGPEFTPNWLPEGNALVFGDAMESHSPTVHLLDLKTRLVSTLSGSEGLFIPQVSPNGRFVAAITLDSMKLLLFDNGTKKWVKLLQGQFINKPTWSQTGEYIYFSDPEKANTPFYRLRIRDRKLEQVAVANLARGVPFGISGRWTGLSPNDAPVLIRDTSIEEIYSLTAKWP